MVASQTSQSSVAPDPVAAFLQRPLEQVTSQQILLLNPSLDASLRSISTLNHTASQFSWASVLELSTFLLAESDGSSDGMPVLDAQSLSSTTRPAHTTKPDSKLLPHDRLLCTLYRALALLQTRQLDKAADAIYQLGDLSDSNTKYNYESYPSIYPGKHGSFIPFELKLLAIEVRVRRDDNSAILDAYKLKQQLSVQTKPQVKSQIQVLLSALCSYHLRFQEEDAAVDVARELVQVANSAEVWYTYGRVLLHVGDIHVAQRAFSKAHSLTSDDGTSRPKATLYIHNAMVLAAQGKYVDAVALYDDVAHLVSHQGQLGIAASNNAAICLLHIGHLNEAIDRIEGALRRQPEQALDEGLIFNLATLYDLAFPDSAAEKKRVLRRLASKFGRQGFDLECIHL